ncbi:MAG TPA: hypothetical protein VFG86_24270, partial [Chloroflexota bacterium]|nr:hypothetical protein [Chloroflexota bacterium]
MATPATSVLDAVYSYVDSQADRFVDELRAFVRQPSRTGFLEELRVAAEYVSTLGRAAGWS